MNNRGSVTGYINLLEEQIVGLIDLLEEVIDIKDLTEGFKWEEKVKKEIKEIKNEMPSLFKK